MTTNYSNINTLQGPLWPERNTRVLVLSAAVEPAIIAGKTHLHRHRYRERVRLGVACISALCTCGSLGIDGLVHESLKEGRTS